MGHRSESWQHTRTTPRRFFMQFPSRSPIAARLADTAKVASSTAEVAAVPKAQVIKVALGKIHSLGCMHFLGVPPKVAYTSGASAWVGGVSLIGSGCF